MSASLWGDGGAADVVVDFVVGSGVVVVGLGVVIGIRTGVVGCVTRIGFLCGALVRWCLDKDVDPTSTEGLSEDEDELLLLLLAAEDDIRVGKNWALVDVDDEDDELADEVRGDVLLDDDGDEALDAVGTDEDGLSSKRSCPLFGAQRSAAPLSKNQWGSGRFVVVVNCGAHA